MKKSISLDEFKKAIEEDNSEIVEEFFEKLFNKPTTQDDRMKKAKECLHKEIDELKTEKDFEKFALKMAEIVLEHYKDKVIEDE